MTSAIDHLVLGTADLAHGSAWLERYFGVALSSVGTQLHMGTHNRLHSLGPSCYLELIAIDPAGEPPFMKRWFGLDTADVRECIAAKPRLLGWVAGTTEIETLSARTGGLLGGVHRMARNDFEWRRSLATFTSQRGLLRLPQCFSSSKARCTSTTERALRVKSMPMSPHTEAQAKTGRRRQAPPPSCASY